MAKAGGNTEANAQPRKMQPPTKPTLSSTPEKHDPLPAPGLHYEWDREDSRSTHYIRAGRARLSPTRLSHTSGHPPARREQGQLLLVPGSPGQWSAQSWGSVLAG